MATALAGAHATYTTPNKFNHRMIIAHHALKVPGMVVYLDAPDAACTLTFIEYGIAKERLVPVNRSDAHCLSIQNKTGIMALCADLFDVVGMCHGVSVFWLDMEQQFVPAETLRRCRDRMASDGMLALTLTFSRYLGGASKHNREVQKQLKDTGFKVLGVEQYTGASGIMNMHFLRAIRGVMSPSTATTTVGDDEDDVSITDDDSTIGVLDDEKEDDRLTQATIPTPSQKTPESYKTPCNLVGKVVFLYPIQETVLLGDANEYFANPHERPFTMTLANGGELPKDSLNFEGKAGRRGVRCRDATDDERDAFFREYHEHLNTVATEDKRKRTAEESSIADAAAEPKKPKKQRRIAPKLPKENFPIYFVENTDRNPTDVPPVVWALTRDWRGGFATAEVEPCTGLVLEETIHYVKKVDRDKYLNRWKDAYHWFSHRTTATPDRFTNRFYIEFDTISADWPTLLYSNFIPGFVVESVHHTSSKIFVTGVSEEFYTSDNQHYSPFLHKVLASKTLAEMIPDVPVRHFVQRVARAFRVKMGGALDAANFQQVITIQPDGSLQRDHCISHDLL